MSSFSLRMHAIRLLQWLLLGYHPWLFDKLSWHLPQSHLKLEFEPYMSWDTSLNAWLFSLPRNSSHLPPRLPELEHLQQIASSRWEMPSGWLSEGPWAAAAAAANVSDCQPSTRAPESTCVVVHVIQKKQIRRIGKGQGPILKFFCLWH